MRDFHQPNRSAVFARNGMCATSHPFAAREAVNGHLAHRTLPYAEILNERPSGPAGNPDVLLSFVDFGELTFDGDPVGIPGSIMAIASVDVSAAGVGEHTIAVRGVDADGNVVAAPLVERYTLVVGEGRGPRGERIRRENMARLTVVMPCLRASRSNWLAPLRPKSGL